MDIADFAKIIENDILLKNKTPDELNTYIINKLKNNKNYWNYLSIETKLSEEFILQYFDKFNFKNLLLNQKFSKKFINSSLFWDNIIKFDLWEILLKKHYLDISFIEKYIDYCENNNVEWSIISRYQKLSEDFMNKYKSKLDWYWISQEQFMTLEFIADNINLINWKVIPTNFNISYLLNDGFVVLFKDKPIWENIGHMEKVTEDCLNLFYDNIPETAWIDIFENKKLSLDFIEKYISNNKCVSNDIWNSISEYEHMTNDFIDKYKNFLDWNILSENYPFTKENIIKFQNNISFYNLSKNDIINDDVLNLILSIAKKPEKFDWEYISEYSNISLDFAEKCKYTNKELYMNNINIKTHIVKNKLYDKL